MKYVDFIHKKWSSLQILLLWILIGLVFDLIEFY
jgi:hypothetical protein